MTAPLVSLSPLDARAHLEAGRAVLIDVREADEFARAHIAGAHSLPLSQWGGAPLPFDAATEIIFTCRSGMRTAAACDRLAASAPAGAFVLDGGVEGWKKAGLALIVDPSAPMEIMRQVQIAAGALVLLGLLLGWLVDPRWFGIAAFVGAGLVFAGVTGFCGMARLLMLAPWNRRAAA